MAYAQLHIYKETSNVGHLNLTDVLYFYRAMHFSAKRGLAIACRPSVCPSVTLVDCDHIGWKSTNCTDN